MKDLNSTLNEVRDKIKNHRQEYITNEKQVRTQLIDPILTSIGWDVQNPNLVKNEYRTDYGPVDYLLIKKKPVLIIESKNLNEEIGKIKDFSQILKYCSALRVKYGLITNGLHWILFEPNKEKGKVHERILWKMNIETEDKDLLSLKFKMLSFSKINNINNGLELLKKMIRSKIGKKSREQAKFERKRELLKSSWKNLLKNQGGIKEALLPFFSKYLNKNKSRNDKFTKTEISNFLLEKIRENILSDSRRNIEKGVTDSSRLLSYERKKVIIKNSPPHNIEKNKQYEILTYSANWLIKKGKLKASNCPINVAGGKKYLVNRKPVHEDGSPFRGAKPLDNGLWIDTAFNLPTKIKYSKELFEQLGISPDTIKIE
jgi:predicted type IV restriction endonuclease